MRIAMMLGSLVVLSAGAAFAAEPVKTPTPPPPVKTPTPPPPVKMEPIPAKTVYGNFAGAALGVNASLNGAVAFPADHAFNQDISKLPVDPNSAAIIASIGLTKPIHPDFGSGTYNGSIIGIPYDVVSGKQAKVAIKFTAYGSESDAGPYPIPGDAPIERQKPAGGTFDGDRHVLVVDKDANKLYELFNAFKQPNGSWNADSGAVFNLASTNIRPTGRMGWTSADAAGLPIFPGLVRYDEVAAGKILHAIRFTVAHSRRAYVAPATHFASSNTATNLPPMGMRVRLKASYQIPASFSPETKVILTAMKTYGLILADNGSDWFISGAPDPRWNNDKLVNELRQVVGSNFEVVKMSGVVVGGK